MSIAKTIFQRAAVVLQNGGIIAYPTEAVYGLGCDPLNSDAVEHLLSLKCRSQANGLILIAADWSQVADFTMSIDPALLASVLQTWPGPNTWLFPASVKAPKWITGEHNTIALRVTAHPIAKAICQSYGGAIVSTSANITGFAPAVSADAVLKQFPQGVDLIVPGQVGGLTNPTTIRDVSTGKILR